MTTATSGANASRLPARSRDKRPALALLALLLVLVGALGSALLVYRTGNRVQVLVASQTIQQGAQVTEDDFNVTEIAFEEGAQVVSAESLPQFVGSQAVSTIPQGSLVSGQMFTPSELAEPGVQQVGVVVASPGRPADAMRAGDIVRVFATAPESAVAAAEDAEQLVEAAKVVAVGPVVDTSDTIHVTLLLPEDAAPAVVAASATGTVALSLLPADTTPVVDWRTE
ncbi:SAF domain-containing protein [uncultured Serinicoccus sp.]|uniref:SAF domain-containing protein n=1 Tax=uncultured Serinicoccus sp. TaxID=735514 RepID=UPI00262B4FEF|nr:SAF domain-containing protein [uncultured Serinicoccus sp.]